MFKIAVFVVVVSLGWYMGGEVYGKQHRSALARVSDSYVQDQQRATPELTNERIEVLRRIAGISNEAKLSSESISTSGTDALITSSNGVASRPVDSALVSNVRSNNAEWEYSQGINNYTGVKEGLAFSAWTTLSSSVQPAEDKVLASLVASCNDEGERLLYIRMLSAYPGFETAQHVNSVTGQVGWDSSNPYSAPFTYDVRLNALRLKAGIEDSLSMIRDGNNVTIKLPWHEGHQAAFVFSLAGSSQAIDTVFDYCVSRRQS